MGSDRIGVMMVSAVSEDRIDAAKAQINVVLLRRMRGGDCPPTFS
jgi:hypothetical protein